MADKVLVATHLSSLYSPSQTTSISVPTSRRNAPLPPLPSESEPPAEHASLASIFHSTQTGTVLIRIIHHGLILELVSMSTSTPPIRFVFPAAILPSPAILLWHGRELHILAVTSMGSLYRLVLPLRSSLRLWGEHMDNNWCREYYIRSVQDTVQGIVQVQSTHSVAIALNNGSLIRVDTEFVGDDASDDQWFETVFQHSSFLSSLTSFLHHGSSESAHIVSTASHPQPSDIGHIWTMSRDRTLRLWTAKTGCTAARTLPPSPAAGREVTPTPGSSAPAKSTVLLDPEPQHLLAMFSVEAIPYLLAFIPTPSSSSSGGFFQLFSSSNDSLQLLETFECSSDSCRCHLQDFIVLGGHLYTLWDRQGQSAVETLDLSLMDLSNGIDQSLWRSSLYAYEPDLTPAYLDELLLSPGSLTDKFFSAIMRPGIFSTLTLRTAIDQYTDACLSLPGPPPPQLTSLYATLDENIASVVGCTVHLTRDPHRGVLQHDKYWITLKRDWEGFIARCREVERSARWPLALGVSDPTAGDILFVERECVGILAGEDLPLRLHRGLRAGNSVEPQFAACEIAWTLRTKLGAKTMRALEDRIVDVVHQEIAFPYADIIHDQAQRSMFKEELDEGLESWLLGRLQSVEDIDAATRLVLDLVGGFDREIKREEDEVELLLPHRVSDFTHALTSAYITYSVAARYEFCLSLVVLLFFLSEDLPDWDPALLAETFAVFRGIAMLRYVTEQPAGDTVAEVAPTERGTSAEADEVIARMRNMDVSRGEALPVPGPSLLQRLLAQNSHGSGNAPLPASAHVFMDATGLLQSTSPAHAAKLEVLWCERLRLLGRAEPAREMLEWLPRTPAVMYVWARLWLDIGRDVDAAAAFENLAGSFGPHNSLSFEDADALAAVLPGAQLFDSNLGFYLHVCALFKASGLVDHEVPFARLALSVAPADWDTFDLSHIVIKGSIDLGYWDDAYSALMATPHDRLRRDCARQLVYRMCEEHAIEQLISFNFTGISDEVVESLSFKARNADPRARPSYSRILYTWHVSRGDYRNAALVMYQRARKLGALAKDPKQYFVLTEQQLEAYIVAMNALTLLDQKNAWIVLPVSFEGGQPHKRRRLTKHIPEDKLSGGKRDSEYVELADILSEYTLLSVQVDLVRKDPSLLALSETLLTPSGVVLRLAQSNRFNLALATARTLDVDMTDLFSHLTRQCLRLSRNPDVGISEDMTDWLLTDRVASWAGSWAARGWRYLRQSLERHDSVETDYAYSKIVFETIAGFERTSIPPPWLVQSLEEFHPDWLIRTAMRYDMLEFALEQTLALIRKADQRLAQEPQKTTMSTWLPYALIDQLLVATAKQRVSQRAEKMRRDLHIDISNRTKRMQKLSREIV